MKRKIEHKSSFDGYETFVSELGELITTLDQKHYLERKVKFLLDIRGYLVTNGIKGNYVEFGSYRSEMHFAAFKILSKVETMGFFIGIDTFQGEPEKDDSDLEIALYDDFGDFSCDYDEVSAFVDERMGDRGILLRGDFRSSEFVEPIRHLGPVAVAVIDCNYLSSVKAALKITLQNLATGGIIYFDDYFYNIRLLQELRELIDGFDSTFIEHNFYAPFGKSFVVTSRL